MISVTLAICAYNSEAYIDRAIRSCLSQVLINAQIEVIVVNDGSTDKTHEICKKYIKSIKYINLPKNMGVAAASNIAILNAKHQYFMRVDADDFINQMAVMYLSSVLDSNDDYDFVVSDHVRVDEIGQKHEVIKLDSDHVVYRHGAGVLFRKVIFDIVGLYDETLRNCEDFDLLARIIVENKSKYFRIPIPLYRYYIHGENLTLTAKRAELWRNVANKYGLSDKEDQGQAVRPSFFT